jgi:hypothetical protein
MTLGPGEPPHDCFPHPARGRVASFPQAGGRLGGLAPGAAECAGIGASGGGNPYALLQAVMHDPEFIWLRKVSDLMVRIDEANAKGATPSPEAMQGFLSTATDWRMARMPNSMSARPASCCGRKW